MTLPRKPSHASKRSWKQFGLELYQSISSDDIFGRSAQLAYYFFFALFPGLIFFSALLALFSSPGTNLQQHLIQFAGGAVPPQAYSLVINTFTQTTHGGGKLTFGALAALWSATVGMAAACDTLNAVHDVKESRPYWKVRAVALGLTIVTIVLLLCATGVLVAGDAMIRLSGTGLMHGVIYWLIKVGQWVVAFSLVALVFAITYFFAPDVKERKWHWITPGAVLGILLWICATVGLRIYLHFSHSFSNMYGSLGAVIILLTWFYIGGFAMLTGAEVNAAVENKAAHEGDPEATAKGEKAPEAA